MKTVILVKSSYKKFKMNARLMKNKYLAVIVESFSLSLATLKNNIALSQLRFN